MNYLITLLLAAGCCIAAERPNIVLILADDMGYSDLGCYGSEIETPVLDGLAENGLRYTGFHNAARCCPTRASLLTGLYPHEAGVGGMVYGEDLGPGYRTHLNDTCTTLAQVLGNAGYHTMLSGKWHVGHQTKSVRPEQRGFDRFYGIYLHVDSYFKVLNGCDVWMDGEMQIKGNGEKIPEYPGNPEKEFYTTHVFTDYALTFLDEAYQQEKPFFLYLAYNTPHWPIEAPERIVAKYKGKYDAGWDVEREARYKRMMKMGILNAGTKLPPSDNDLWEMLSEDDQENAAFRREIYAAQVDDMDEQIGRVVEHLKKKGELDNTLILFLSDNGCSAEHGLTGWQFEKNRKSNFSEWRTAGGRSASQGKGWANVSNVPFRKYKRQVHEGGSLTPLIAHWPAKILDKGTFRRDTGHVIDIMPTLCELAGTEVPKGAAGVSLVPTFGDGKLERTEPLYWEHEGNRAIRDGDWKLVKSKGDAWELYLLKDDPTEMNNLAKTHPEKVKAMEAQWTTWAEKANVLPDYAERRAALNNH